MFEADVLDYSIKINLENKIWSFGFNGAMGKTFLYDLLRALQAINTFSDRVLALTYVQNKTEDSYLSEINNFDGDVIILDRFDLYYSERITGALEDKDAIVLLDLKDYVKWQKLPYNGCEITFSGSTVEVNEL